MAKHIYRIGVRSHEDGAMSVWFKRSGWGVSRMMAYQRSQFPTAHELVVERDDGILDRLREAARVRVGLYAACIDEQMMVAVLRECGIVPARGAGVSDRNARLRTQVRDEIARLSGTHG